MTFRRRLTFAAAAAGAIAIAAGAIVTFVVVRDRLYGQIDDSLKAAAGELATDHVMVLNHSVAAPVGSAPPTQAPLPIPGPLLSTEVRYAQVSNADATVEGVTGRSVELPTSKRAQHLARAGKGSYFSDETVGGAHVRVFAQATKRGTVVQVARPLGETDSFVGRLGWILGAIAAGGIALAFGLALWLTRAAAKPLAGLTDATDHVARTRDLSRRIEGTGEDEIGRLAGSFNTMLEELEKSTRAQRQLVADASHELRTPLTSLRTNLEVLARSDAVRGSPQQKLVGDVVGQIEELTVLVGDLVELARDDDQPQLYAEDVRLDEVTAGVVERARLRHPERQFTVDARPVVVHVVPGRLDRAIANLIDNAVKWGPPDRPIEIAVRDQAISVRDHGPGIDPADLPFVFDRFYRATTARGLPGSGLGLAIVRRFAEDSGGAVTVGEPDGGGAQLELALPATSNEVPMERSGPSKSGTAQWPHDNSHASHTRRGGRALGRLGRLRE